MVLVRDEKFRDHLTPELHPESPARLRAIDKALHRSHLMKEVKQTMPRLASEDELSYVHKGSYLEQLQEGEKRAKQTQSIVPLDADTFMSAQTYETAKLAAGAGLVAAEALEDENVDSSFVVVRPPGHHALADRAMGFCLFNNLAVAARYAQKKLGYRRIFVVDWDVHHGNGTQELFFDDPSILFVSFHQYPFWPPDSGWYTEDGAGEGKGYNVNIPLPAGTGDRGYMKGWDEVVEPICQEYQPDLIMLSAGYDAHQEDPLGQQQVSTYGYASLSCRLRQLAEESNSKLIGFLEGGYNTNSLSQAVVATMKVLHASTLAEATKLVEQPSSRTKQSEFVTGDRNPALVDERINEVKRHFARYWRSLRK